MQRARRAHPEEVSEIVAVLRGHWQVWGVDRKARMLRFVGVEMVLLLRIRLKLLLLLLATGVLRAPADLVLRRCAPVLHGTGGLDAPGLLVHGFLTGGMIGVVHVRQRVDEAAVLRHGDHGRLFQHDLARLLADLGGPGQLLVQGLAQATLRHVGVLS